MAYSNTVTVTRIGANMVKAVITETDAAQASEPSAIQMDNRYLSLHRMICSLTAGTGTTVNPVIGSVTDPGGAGNEAFVQAEASAAADPINQAWTGGLRCEADSALKFYHRSRVNNAAADHTIRTEYWFTIGWR